MSHESVDQARKSIATLYGRPEITRHLIYQLPIGATPIFERSNLVRCRKY